MAIIPLRDYTALTLYRCGVCRRYFLGGVKFMTTACVVFHGAGSCCHHNDHEVTPDQYEEFCRQANEIVGWRVPQVGDEKV